MGKITVQIGYETHYSSGTVDGRSPVEFEGKKLAHRRIPFDNKGNRGQVKTLYRTEDGRYLVHIKTWSQWQNEGNDYTLVEATPEDLDAGGKFEYLGREANLARPLTLDEALAPQKEDLPF